MSNGVLGRARNVALLALGAIVTLVVLSILLVHWLLSHLLLVFAMLACLIAIGAVWLKTRSMLASRST